ncbi:STAS domain-containing protein [Streptomyces sp. NPDC058371]|uniref:STAS domain-containing protein n=1 Tax=Streptomyces sp. NPDC058371 TaxID=3346463 RepID=UPI0036484EFA
MSTQTDRLTITELTSCDECAVLRVSGELDHSCEALFLATLGASVDAGHRHLVLDVTALVFCDSRGLNALLAVRWLLERRDGQLMLAGTGRRLTDLLVQTGSTELLPTRPTVGQALLALPAEHRPAWPPPPLHGGEHSGGAPSAPVPQQQHPRDGEDA